jgi:hypothetical protein
MINLLEHFALAHTQVTRLHADLQAIVPREGKFSAKVELKLTPRRMAEEQGANQYQVSARLLCRGGLEGADIDKPMFTIELVLQAVYRQLQGDPVDFSTFSANHASLTRQLYPIIHHQLQPIFKQFGLDQVRLPYDLASAPTSVKPKVGQQIH